MIDNPQQLGDYLKSEATQRGLRLRFDTHYDAQNWVLSWWHGSTLHHLDFQPLENEQFSITHYQDNFKYFPRFMYWAHRVIPMFPNLAKIEWKNIALEHFPLQEQQVATYISDSLNA